MDEKGWRDWITRKNAENELPPQNIYERPGPDGAPTGPTAPPGRMSCHGRRAPASMKLRSLILQGFSGWSF